MTNSTASSSGVGPFDSLFQTGAAVVSAILFLAAIFVGWTGYSGGFIPVTGTELSVVSGAVGLMLLSFFGLVALVAAFFMESGFDH
ncbi:hypothetical protein [Haloterrigena alkaliphila]|uniref:Uncharacterized protein n=1 Tax=Haloterrigena alkaliphila TaxID=2816475 RepID=A0A8A2VL34_9EURY|nr:hypothetical protein [Haloterrigena alkaliphila]QSW98898.1 hypothetical protein J0X25_16160 [Haloterrigena alkaliphila]